MRLAENQITQLDEMNEVEYRTPNFELRSESISWISFDIRHSLFDILRFSFEHAPQVLDLSKAKIPTQITAPALCRISYWLLSFWGACSLTISS